MISPKKKNQKTRVLLHLFNREKNFIFFNFFYFFRIFDMISSLSLLSGKQPLKKRRCKEICTEKEKGGVKSKVYRYIIV